MNGLSNDARNPQGLSRLREQLLLVVEQFDVLRCRLRRRVINEFAEDGFAILREFNHAGEHISILVGMPCRATALAFDLHDEEPWMYLSENTDILYDLRTTHIRAYLDLLANEVVQGIVDAVYDLCLLGEIHSLPFRCLIFVCGIVAPSVANGTFGRVNGILALGCIENGPVDQTEEEAMFKQASFADLPKFRAAHSTNGDGGTGCTVFVAPEGAVGAVDVRGGAPATRETDLLRPENMIDRIHAVVLSGGSAFGLEAACGVMEALAKQDIGFHLAGSCVPIVCGASLFDLPVGCPVWPRATDGAQACEEALATGPRDLPQGCVGAGTGATVGKMGLPVQAMKSGFGWAGLRQAETVVVACVAVNALGNVMADDGSWVAGTLGEDGHVEDPLKAAARMMAAQAHDQVRAQAHDHEGKPVSNTTLGCVLTNACLTKAQATKVAQIAQDAYARHIKPAHTRNDGDAIFVMASGEVEAQVDMVAIMATEAMGQAILSAVRHATSSYGLKAAKDIR